MPDGAPVDDVDVVDVDVAEVVGEVVTALAGAGAVTGEVWVEGGSVTGGTAVPSELLAGGVPGVSEAVPTADVVAVGPVVLGMVVGATPDVAGPMSWDPACGPLTEVADTLGSSVAVSDCWLATDVEGAAAAPAGVSNVKAW